jgi:DNA-binding CsgD family transcriptional regulator
MTEPWSEHPAFDAVIPERASAPAPVLGRQAESEALDLLVEQIRGGTSRALVVHGEAGIGKTAMLEYLTEHARGCQVIRAAGFQTEMELAFATLHQLCAPLQAQQAKLPAPQQGALRIAFGLSAGPPPDRFLVGLAVLTLLADAAAKRPLLCVVDDYQWVDHASARVLAFVARRLGAESVGMVFGTRVQGGDLSGLPELALTGLREADARDVLAAAMPGPIDARVIDQIVAEAQGNPLALLELPRSLPAAELAGGFGLPGAVSLPRNVEEGFRRRLDALPDDTRRLLVVAAADPAADAALVWQAASSIGIGTAAAGPAADAGLATFDSRARFRHPLVRSVVYQSAPAVDRQQAHAALADVTDPELHPDRRAWHRAQATVLPDEDVAAELVRSAGRAQARGGLAAAAAFLQRAATLTPDPARRAERALAAADTKLQAGAFDAAKGLLVMAEVGPLSELDRARVDLLRAQLSSVTNRGSDAPLLLVRAARQLEPIDADLARQTYLHALTATMFAGQLASPGGGVLEVSRAAAAAPRSPEPARVPDLLLEGLAANFSDGYSAGVPALRAAVAAFGDDMSAQEELRWMWLANEAALHLWDDARWDTLSARYVHLARSAGSLSELPLALSTRSYLYLFQGRLEAAGELNDEGQAVTEATGSSLAPYAAMALAALRGEEVEGLYLIEDTIKDAALRGEGIGIAVAEWTKAVLYNGLSHYREAVDAAQQALYQQQYPDMAYPGVANWAAAELVEAAVHAGMTDVAEEACRWIAAMADASGTSWALGVSARARALLADGAAAEDLYQAAVTHLTRARVHGELARAHLLYGQWLRRERRRAEARTQLRTAHDMLQAMGMAAFADRASRELEAAGVAAARQRASLAPGNPALTAQEAQIARLARDGMSTPEIAARMYLSRRTVQYHLGNIFAKLGISSRKQLAHALPPGPDEG